MEADRQGRKARELVRRATRLAESTASAPIHRERLALVLASEQVETKLLKRERYRHAAEEATIELDGACARLAVALTRLREALQDTTTQRS